MCPQSGRSTKHIENWYKTEIIPINVKQHELVYEKMVHKVRMKFENKQCIGNHFNIKQSYSSLTNQSINQT